jgi:hypothetical protein
LEGCQRHVYSLIVNPVMGYQAETSFSYHTYQNFHFSERSSDIHGK